jgi:hypothetical protein
MIHKSLTTNHTTITISVNELPGGTKDYLHTCVVTHKDKLIATCSLYNKRKKLDAWDWSEAFELMPPKMRTEEWSSMIRELDEQLIIES